MSSSFIISKFNIFVTCGLSLKKLTWRHFLRRHPNCNFSTLCFLCPTTVGPGGPRAQRFSPAVCLWEAEGAAGPDGGPRLRGPDGDRWHRARQAAPGVPPRPLNLQFFLHKHLATVPPPPIFESDLPNVWTPNPALPNLYPCYALSIFRPSLVDCPQLTPLVPFFIIWIPLHPFFIKVGSMWVLKNVKVPSHF